MATEDRTQIEAHIVQLQQAIREMSEQAQENARKIREYGLSFGVGGEGQPLHTGGLGEVVAPRLHPVWASEIAYEARTIQGTGAATVEYEPLWRRLEQWQARRASGERSRRQEPTQEYGVDRGW